MSELVEHFGTLDNFKIAEIGVGYGGQCMTITNYFDVQNYTLIDLPEVLALAKRYLSINDSSNLEFKTMSELKVSEYDLIISNYAITECNKRVQLEYINKVLRGSKHGYITCNYISDYFNIDSLTKDEFIEALGPDKQVKIVDEQPLTHARNFILIW